MSERDGDARDRHEVEGRPVLVRVDSPRPGISTVEATITAAPGGYTWREHALAHSLAAVVLELAHLDGGLHGRVDVVGGRCVAFETARPRSGLAIMRDAIHLAHRRASWLALAPAETRPRA